MESDLNKAIEVSVDISVWGSVRDVRKSVMDSVGYSVYDSVRDSVESSVWDSVDDSVGDSVWSSVNETLKEYNK